MRILKNKKPFPKSPRRKIKEIMEKQCSNCIYNWKNLRGGNQSGYCYMFKNYVDNCAQKKVG